MSNPHVSTDTHTSATEYGPFALERTEANLIVRAADKLRAYFSYNRCSHIGAYGIPNALPEPDPCEHEELCDFAEALVKIGDEFAQVFGYWGWGSPARRADLVFDMSIEAYEAGHDPGRIERAARMVLVELPGLDDSLDAYGTTYDDCRCKDKQYGGQALCKHQIAMKMLGRLCHPWNEQVDTFKRSPDTSYDIPF